jgi:hypothetical protein
MLPDPVPKNTNEMTNRNSTKAKIAILRRVSQSTPAIISGPTAAGKSDVVDRVERAAALADHRLQDQIDETDKRMAAAIQKLGTIDPRGLGNYEPAENPGSDVVLRASESVADSGAGDARATRSVALTTASAPDVDDCAGSRGSV